MGVSSDRGLLDRVFGKSPVTMSKHFIILRSHIGRRSSGELVDVGL